jgi:membrane associated rhomboid family serine protease
MSDRSLIRRPFPYRFYNVTVALIVINIGVFLLNQMSRSSILYLGLFPQLVVQRGFYWQIATYMFVHGSFGHILFNMLGLFIFGIQLEREMGSSEFLLFYLLTGIGTGLISFALGANVVGASGAIYALLLGFATYFPYSRIYIWGILPMRAPVAVVVFAGLSLFFQFSGMAGGIAHFAHLAGIVLGYIYFLVRLNINPISVFLGSR